MVEQWIFNSVQKILAEQVKEEQLQADKLKEENTPTTENHNEKDNLDDKSVKENIETLFVEMKTEPKLENIESNKEYKPASNVAQSPADLFMEAMQSIPEVPSSFPVSAMTSSLNVSDANYLTTTAVSQTIMSNNLISNAIESPLKQEHVTSAANNTLSFTSNDTSAGNDITRMNISSDAAEAAQLLSEIANQVPFQFQELQMRSTNANNLQMTSDQMLLENSVKMEGVESLDNLHSQLSSLNQNNVVNNAMDQSYDQRLPEQTAQEQATPDQNADTFPPDSAAPQPIETTLADGSTLYTITTVEDMTEDEMLKKASLQSVDNSGNDDPMSDWFPSYLMCSSAPEAMKSHLQQKLCSLG